MLFSRDGGSTPRALKYISAGRGEGMVTAGKAERLYSRDGVTFQGYVLLGGETPVPKSVDPDKASPTLDPFSCTFTRSEIDLLQEGRSATAAKREEWERLGFQLDIGEMDRIEQARVKQSIYRDVH